MRRRDERELWERVGREVLRVTFITDIMTPYMVAVFDELALKCDLTVLFGSQTSSRAMTWSFAEPSFRYRVVGGQTIARKIDAADIYPSPRLLLELWRSHPDLVITGGFSFPSLYAAAYRRLSRGRLLIQSDGTSRSEANIGWSQRVSRAVLARVADGAVGNSRLAVQRFGELRFGPVFEVPHSTDIEPFLAVGRARIPRADAEMRVVTVGRLLVAKGIDLLLQAVARARAEGATVALDIVGSGKDERRLRGLAEELGLTDVGWHGFVDPRDLPAYLARADTFAFPTLGDTFGIVLLEAAAAGLPLISSPHAGATGDLVEEGRTGYVVEPGDTDAYARALTTLAGDQALRQRMGDAAHRLACGRTPASAAERYLRAAETVLLT